MKTWVILEERERMHLVRRRKVEEKRKVLDMVVLMRMTSKE